MKQKLNDANLLFLAEQCTNLETLVVTKMDKDSPAPTEVRNQLLNMTMRIVQNSSDRMKKLDLSNMANQSACNEHDESLIRALT